MIFAALIHQTKHIMFGSGVHCLPDWHPCQVAGMVAQFDHMAKGRYMMGIGPGAAPPDFEMFGVVDKDRMAMLEESIDMIVKLWTTDPPYDIRGKYWQAVVKDNVLPDLGVAKMTEPYQKPHPPIMLPCMSRGSSSARLVARRGWNSISANFVPADIAKSHWRDYCDERKKHGLEPEPHKFAFGRTLLVTETDEEAETYLHSPGNALEWYFNYIIGLTSHGGFVGMLKGDPDMPDSEVTPRYCIDSMVIAGSPKTVAEKLAAFREDTAPFETSHLLAPRLGRRGDVAAPHASLVPRGHADPPRSDGNEASGRAAARGGVGAGEGGVPQADNAPFSSRPRVGQAHPCPGLRGCRRGRA